MNVFRRHQDLKSFSTIIKFYSVANKNHYDVLNLRKNCTEKEIKEAYIQLSKEYHPDKNKDKKAQDKFVRIVEAYNVLGKPSSRAHYDNITEISSGSSAYVYRTHVPYNLRKNPQYSYYYGASTKSHTAKENTNTYYGVQGVKKLPNYYIVVMCCGVALIGMIMQMYVIRNMYVLHRTEALEKSKRLAEELDKVRSAAKENGNELQTRILMEKIVNAANPTVATASLGQALASEKKDVSETLLTEFGISEEMGDAWFYDSYDKCTLEQEKKVLYDLIQKIGSYII